MIAMLRPKPSAIDFGNILCMEILFLEDCCLQVCVCARVCILAHNMREREMERRPCSVRIIRRFGGTGIDIAHTPSSATDVEATSSVILLQGMS